jgi:hypothetical protein
MYMLTTLVVCLLLAAEAVCHHAFDRKDASQ